mgnify:CR=1 FL=1
MKCPFHVWIARSAISLQWLCGGTSSHSMLYSSAANSISGQCMACATSLTPNAEHTLLTVSNRGEAFFRSAL